MFYLLFNYILIGAFSLINSIIYHLHSILFPIGKAWFNLCLCEWTWVAISDFQVSRQWCGVARGHNALTPPGLVVTCNEAPLTQRPHYRDCNAISCHLTAVHYLNGDNLWQQMLWGAHLVPAFPSICAEIESRWLLWFPVCNAYHFLFKNTLLFG